MADKTLKQMKDELDSGTNVSYTDNLQATIEGLSKIIKIPKLGNKTVRDAQLDDQTSKVVLTLWEDKAERAQEGPVNIKYAYLKKDSQKGYVLNIQRKGSITFKTQKTPVTIKTATSDETTKSRPIGHVKIASIQATIWARKTPQFGNADVHSVTVKRQYVDSNGQWHDTNWFRRQDVPDVVMALQEAYKKMSKIKID